MAEFMADGAFDLVLVVLVIGALGLGACLVEEGPRALAAIRTVFARLRARRASRNERGDWLGEGNVRPGRIQW